MRILAAAVVAVTILSGCTTTTETQATVATPQERADAKHAIVACAVRVIPTVDDGISSADVVGRAAAAQCQAETNNALAVELRG